MKEPGAAENDEAVPILEAPGKIEGAVVCFAHLGGRVAFGGHQRRPERNQQIQLLRESPVRLREPAA